MEKRSYWGILGGMFLIGIGIIFLLGQFFRFNFWHYIWPFFILAFGGAFFAGMWGGGRSTGALAIPGSILTTIGLILLVQNTFHIWGTWAYAWTLIISGVGTGFILFGNRSDLPDLRHVGRLLVAIGLALFFVFGAVFELGAALFHMRSPSGLFWPVILILAGIYLLAVRPILRRSAGPIESSFLAFTPWKDTSGLADQEIGITAVEPGQVAGIRRVTFRSPGNLSIVQGEREGLEIEANQAFRQRIRTLVNGDHVDIRYDSDWWDWINLQHWNDDPVRFTLYLRELNALKAAGLGNVLISGLTASSLDLVHSGAGNTTVHQLSCENLTVRQAGLGDLEINGHVTHQEIDLSGAGNYRARGLESQIAHVRLGGLGNVTISVAEDLDASINGAGSVDYFGNPRINQRVSGLGSIRKAG